MAQGYESRVGGTSSTIDRPSGVPPEDSFDVSDTTGARWLLALESAGQGAWDWNIPAGTMVFSPMALSMLGYERSEISPAQSEWISRIHPDDAARVAADVQAHFERKTSTYSNEHRLRCKDGSWKWIFASGTVIRRGPADEPLRMVGTCSDISSRKADELARSRYVRHLKVLSRINHVSTSAQTVQAMLEGVLDIVLDEFDADRAWFLFPCDPDAATWSIPMERTRPSWPGALAMNVSVPMEPQVASLMRQFSRGPGPCQVGPGTPYPVPESLAAAFNVKSGMGTELRPKVGKPWMFGLHHCEKSVVHEDHDVALFDEIAQRIADSLTSLITFENLRDSESRYRLIVETANEGICTLSTDHRITFANPKLGQMLGRTVDELIGQPLDQFVDAEFATELNARLRGRADSSCDSHDVSFRRKDGSRLWASVATSPISRGSQAPQGALAMITDITARRQAETDVRQSRRRLQELIDSTHSIVWEADATSLAFTFVSSRAEQLLGFPRSAWLSDPHFWISHLHPQDRDETLRQLAEIARSDHAHEIEYRMIAADGKIFHLRNIVSANTQCGPPTLRGLMSDVTTQRALEDQLRQSQKMEMIGQLAGGIAHDFNNMLCVILNSAEMALRRVPFCEPIRSDLNNILSAARRSADLTQQLLAYARKQPVNPRVLDVNHAVTSIISMLARLIGENIEIRWNPGANAGLIKIDPIQLHQVLTNLAVNARDAITGPGMLTIRTDAAAFDEAHCAANPGFRQGDFVLLSISDTGRGMEQATLEHVFEPFFTTKALGKGTGLGCATVHGIIDQNGGFIQVRSTPGEGTTFDIFLPRAVANSPAPIPEDMSGAARGSETILVVEDEDKLLTLIASVLHDCGYTVLRARGPSEAINISQSYHGSIDLILSDVVMPSMNGRDLARLLHSERPALRALFMSGYADDTVRRGSPQESANFIQKPFSFVTLTARVRETLDAGRAAADGPPTPSTPSTPRHS